MNTEHQNIIFEISRVIEKYRNSPNIEIECRLGWFTGHTFDTNIQKRYYDNILKQLMKCHELTHTFEQTSVYFNKHVRIIADDDTKKVLDVHIKKRIEIIDFKLEGTPYDLRISVCVENPVQQAQVLDDCVKLRDRNRHSFRYKTWRYDITHSVSHNHVYECEIELDINQSNIKQLSSLYLAQSMFCKIHDIIHISIDGEVIHLKKNLLLNKKAYKA